MLSFQRGLKDEGVPVSMIKLCQWSGVVRFTTFYADERAGKIQC